MNVLVYSGAGTSSESALQTLECLRHLLSSNYAVSFVTENQLLKEPWPATTAMLAIPGGADLPYCKSLDGKGNGIIKKYIRSGGRYLGICAGGYYGTAYCEFEKNTHMEVSGPRELAFYNGISRGACFKGFQYGSNKGAHAALVKTDSGQSFRTFINGGCLFTGDPKAEVICRYAEPLQCESDESEPAAVVLCKYGQGRAVLTGIHPEYCIHTVRQKDDLSSTVAAAVEKDDPARLELMRDILNRLGLKVDFGQTGPPIPQLTPLLLSQKSLECTPSISELLLNLGIAGDKRDFADSNDTFVFCDPDQLVNYKVSEDCKPIGVFMDKWPSPRLTPYFDQGRYFEALEARQDLLTTHPTGVGNLLLYGETVTSTSTMIDRNAQFLRCLPHGMIVLGSRQVQGHGRGTNVWVSPIGVLAVSGVLRVPASTLFQSLVFMQYLISLAIVDAVHSFGPRYTELDVRLKWPNDIYIRKGATYVKIGGVIASCNFFDNEYVLSFGAGTNVTNSAPTTSINTSIEEYNKTAPTPLKPITIEDLLARMITRLDEMFTVFLAQGFAPFEGKYYEAWLHSGAVVHLDQYAGTRVKIRGITPDTGLLLVQEVDREDRPTGAIYELQPDGNSFDMLKGLIKKKE